MIQTVPAETGIQPAAQTAATAAGRSFHLPTQSNAAAKTIDAAPRQIGGSPNQRIHAGSMPLRIEYDAPIGYGIDITPSSPHTHMQTRSGVWS